MDAGTSMEKARALHVARVAAAQAASQISSRVSYGHRRAYSAYRGARARSAVKPLLQTKVRKSIVQFAQRRRNAGTVQGVSRKRTVRS